ncbi:MAG: hypothetical protein JRF63_06265 [Deltaproteobacteria bacterium]|nr:hypothetical protein [Deltaproteobacteria bacterium]
MKVRAPLGPRVRPGVRAPMARTARLVRRARLARMEHKEIKDPREMLAPLETI